MLERLCIKLKNVSIIQNNIICNWDDNLGLIYLFMKIKNQQFKLQIVLHEQRQSKRKLSADYRYRERVKQPVLTPSQTGEKYRYGLKSASEKATGCLNTISHRQRESKQFQDKCVSLLSKKKSKNSDNATGNTSNFNTMLQNIKSVLKENQKRQREFKVEQQPLCNNQFQCVRSQIHQIYAYQQKIQLYKMIRNNQSRNRIYSCRTDKSQKNSSHQVTLNKPLNNPFFNKNTVVCFTMALNDPNIQKKQCLFQAPALLRTSATSAGSKRVVQIAKTSGSRQMNFNLNSDPDNQYTRKIKNFFQFIFKVNYANNLYVSIQLAKSEDTILNNKYRVYVGKGNNSLLIKSLMKRRFWWEIADSYQSANIHFYWSQNIIDEVNNKQKRSSLKYIQGGIKNKRYKDQQESIDYNRKILTAEKCKTVENYITKDGFLIPFQQVFVPDIISNHLPRNYCIGSKKNLFKSLFHYYTMKNRNPFNFIPKTYHISSGEDQGYRKFIKQNQNQPQKVWIVKPGENSNRGKGIRLSTFRNINLLIKKSHKHQNGQPLTYIVQSYINKPFLYNNRKFDIRHYILITSINGLLKAYWYKEGYIRTSSQLFDLEDLDNNFVHLTNDAIQRNSEYYQKYQPANKLSYSEFQRYLDYTFPSKNYNLEKDILHRMKELANDVVKANYKIIDHKRSQNNFQIFGLDFMIDRDFKPWLIEVNYNPCLQVNCPVLQRIIPAMLQNTLRLSIDPLFPPTSHFPASKRFYLSDNYLKNLKYELIFDEQSFVVTFENNYDFIDEKQQEQQYQDEGKQISDLLV